MCQCYARLCGRDVNLLRDNRSATKSITDVLAGIAIEEHKPSGVDAKILSLLRDRATIFLTMSSALECYDGNDFSRGLKSACLVEDWTQFILDLPGRGSWQDRIVSEHWVHRSTQPNVRIDEVTEYGYLWRLKSLKSGEKSYPAFFMSGNGGNKVVVLPGLDLLAVITSTN